MEAFGRASNTRHQCRNSQNQTRLCSSTSLCAFHLSSGGFFFSRPVDDLNSQKSYAEADIDPRTGQPLDIGTSDLEKKGSAKKTEGFFEKGLLRSLETQHRGAGGIPEVKVVGNGHSHGKAPFVLCARCSKSYFFSDG